MNPVLINIFAFLFGAIVGSFLNVCIFRIPLGVSLISPSSHCPHCKIPLKAYDNIPILSYFLLGGRCRNCGAPISVRYPLVETMMAVFSVLLVLKFGLSLSFFISFILISSLVVVSFIDLDHRIIPDKISLPGIILGFLASFIKSAEGQNDFLVLFVFKTVRGALSMSTLDSLLGIFIGGGLLYAVAILFYWATKKEGMGGGDIKLLAMIGAFLGWSSTVFTILVSSLFGSIVGITIMVFKGADSKYAIPFGPFISMGAVIYLFFGREIIRWYLQFRI
ncbi:MAG: prepilin peptidase [Syntrophobacterales bacterium]|nr:MAG: prepilin peptidase [Syntrophobacterales bacterium]